MWRSKILTTSAIAASLLSTVHGQSSSCPAPALADTAWYAPNLTEVNSLTSVLNSTGVYGFVFNSSTTPSGEPYSTYNWCNAPHTRAQEYVRPNSSFKLEYVEVIHRHHKRTPYAANTFPRETIVWNCNDESLFYYGAPEPDNGAAQIAWQVYQSPANPLAPSGFNGSCQFPQISGQGLYDSRQHGKDLFGVYHNLLNFLPATLNSTSVTFRVTNNVITSEVASQVILGMYPETNATKIQVAIQPDSIDSLEPAYTCNAASALYSSYGVGSTNPNWTAHLTAPQSQALYAKIFAVGGVNASDPNWNQWADHSFDRLSAGQCHQKPFPCSATNASFCVNQTDADAVYRRGEYEYSFIYRDSQQSLNASTGSFGIWLAELAANLRSVVNGTSSVIYHHNVAHDGSMARLLSILQVDVMVWPSMGSEAVFELYSSNACWYVRVLWQGQVMRSSNPSLGLLDMVPVGTLLNYIDALVGVNAVNIPGMCSTS